MKTMITKNLFVTVIAGLSFLLPASAVTIDTQAYGESLNGWRKNRTAFYSIDNHSYLTHQPTVSPSPDGGIFVSTCIEHAPRFGKKTTSYLELSYNSAGTLLTIQIKIMAGDLRLNTGLISRPALIATPAEGEVPAVALPWTTPTKTMVNSLFKALDTEFAKLSKKEEEGKKDVFSRVFGTGSKSVGLSAALRHNLNLLLRHTR